MKQIRLNVHYETLYLIVAHRYNGISPEAIKKDILNSETPFDIEYPLCFSEQALDKKKQEYIYAEVSKALKALARLKKKDEDLEDYDDTYYFDENVTDEQKEDYKYYSNSIVIGVKNLTRKGEETKRNAYYRLNKNIKFSTKDATELKLASSFLYLQFTNSEDALVDDDMVKFITAEREIIIEDDYKDFIVDTFVQITTYKDKVVDKKYSLHLLLTLASLQAKINIQINSNNSIYNLNNIVIDSLVFDKDKFDIKCNGIQFSLSSIEDIQFIESASTNTIRENIQESDKILCNYSKELQSYFKDFVNNFTGPCDMFFQKY